MTGPLQYAGLVDEMHGIVHQLLVGLATPGASLWLRPLQGIAAPYGGAGAPWGHRHHPSGPAAGVLQLVRAMGFDQFDKARRVLALGAGRQLLPRQYKPAQVAKALDEVVDKPALRARSAALAKTLAGERPGTVAAVDAVPGLASRFGV